MNERVKQREIVAVTRCFFFVYVDENLLHDNLIFWWKIASYHICVVTELEASRQSKQQRRRKKNVAAEL